MRFGYSMALLLATASPTRAATCGGASGLDLKSEAFGFGAGALVIPMDTCHNPDNAHNPGPTNTGGACGALPDHAHPGGARCYNRSTLANGRHPFGMVYLLLQNGIPVHIILNHQKAGLADADFSVSATGAADTVALLAQDHAGVYQKVAPASGMSCGTNTVHYGSMPFVIDASFAQQAITVLEKFNASHSNQFADVPLHIANYSFTAPVLGTLESRPKPVLIDSPPLDTFFDESGIPDTVAADTTFLMMKSGYTFDWPSSLGSNGTCATHCDTLSGADGRNFIDVIWSTNFDGRKNDIGSLNHWAAMPAFFKQGGTLLAIDSGITWESAGVNRLGGTLTTAARGDAKGPFCAAAVSARPASPLANAGTPPEYPASNRFLQIGAIDFSVKGNGGGQDGTSLYAYSSAPTAAGVEGLANSDGWAVIAGHPLVDGEQAPGNLVYLGSLNSWHGGSNKNGGLHIMYDTLIVGTGCGVPSTNVATELTRSSAVATSGATAAKVAEYLGTFDWLVPRDPKAMGNVLYTPDPSRYPYMTGHFREYKQAGTFTNDRATDFQHCDAGSTASACNWDAAARLPAFASRSIYLVTGSAGSWTMKAVSSLNDATLRHIAGKLDQTSGGVVKGVLGGIDFGAPAIIEGLPTGLVSVANAKGRPTLAYVGARDGMLHAFCVSGSGGKCYGKHPGEEVWALILPGMKKLLDAAYVSMDFSKVNLGGLIRVADIRDSWGGAAGYRTVLLVGSHDSGYVDALDVSDPDPANLNQPGFSFLWEQDGAKKADGTTQEPMGKTWGATFALTGSLNGGAAALVTASTCRGSVASCPSTVQNGMNLYLLRMKDGLVVDTVRHSYRRSSLVFGAPIENDVPAAPTTLDADHDGFDELVLAPSLEGYVYRYTLKPGTAPTLATIDSGLTLFDASGSRCSDSGVACEPIGASVSIVRNLKGSQLGAVVVTGGVDQARSPSASQAFHVYEFDPEAADYTTGYASRALPAMTPPISGAPGGAAGVTGTSLALRSFAQPMVSGSDLYVTATTLSLGRLSQVVQPVITPGTYGTILRFADVNDGTTLPAGAYAVAQGSAFAGGAGATFTSSSSSGPPTLFAADVTGASSQTLLSAPASSTPSSAFAVNQATPQSGRTFLVQMWLDGAE